jgi:16S rRNA (guanine527-N7)-methyltransferase
VRGHNGVPRPSPSLDTDAPGTAEAIGLHARELGIELSASQCERLDRFTRLLQRWNRTHNLTAITRTEDIVSHHLLDSLSLASELPAPPALRVLDAGSGAGLPGIPLAIALPAHHFTLVDAVGKKCAFITQARLELATPNVEVIHSRLEQLHGLQFDAIVSRALGSLASFVSSTRHLLAPHGRWIGMKGQRPEEELQQLPPGVTASRIVTLRVPLLDEARHLVVLQPAPQTS